MITRPDVSGFTAHRIREEAATQPIGFVLDFPACFSVTMVVIGGEVLAAHDQQDDDVTKLVREVCAPVLRALPRFPV